MALTTRLSQHQSQSLVLTPQLQQAIKMLQLSNIELHEFVEEELERNPMLEREGFEEDDIEGSEKKIEIEPENPELSERVSLEDINFERPAHAEIQPDSGLDVDYENIYTSNNPEDDQPLVDTPNNYSEPVYSGGVGLDTLAPNLEQTLSELPLIRNHLVEQLNMEFRDEISKIIGLYLIENLDDSGYLTIGLDEISAALGCDENLVNITLKRVQDFDPPGIFARNLRECLALQLKNLNRLDPCMEIFLDNLELLAAHDLKKLQTACACDAEDLADMIQEIRSLSPKPALAFDQNITPPVIPDVLMRPALGNGWIVELNSETLPRVLINNHYHAHVRREARTKNEKAYINEQFQAASWLVKALHQRATTIMKVASELIRQQHMFFTHGVEHLKPIVLRDIADAIEMHESTVSRVTSNKYMATPRGTFELKYFFTSAIASSEDGEAHSAEAVRHKIKILIDEEPANKILSDDKIVTLLQADGVDIARRTVAKYRESMRIPSSVQRRRKKAMLANI